MSMAKAAQVSTQGGGGSDHVVGFGDLKVVIFCESPGEWYAQALDIDYIAQGRSLDAVQSAFERGLTRTIREHLRLFGSIQKLLEPAPGEIWAAAYRRAGDEFSFSHVSRHKLDIPYEDSVLVAETSKARRKKIAAPVRQLRLPYNNVLYLYAAAA